MKSNSNSIEENLNNLKNNIKNKLNNEQKFYELMYIADNLAKDYVERYLYKDLDQIITEYSDLIANNYHNNKNNKGIRTDSLLYYDKGNFEKIFSKLRIEERKSINTDFAKNFIYEGNFIKLKFKLNKHRQAVFDEAKIKKNDTFYDIRGQLQYLSLENLCEYLEKSGHIGAKKYVEARKNEFEYKKVILKDLYDYIMFSIMEKSPDLNGAKTAIVFALHFNADMRIPVKYSLSRTDENNKNIIDLYKLMYKDDIKCYIDYFQHENRRPLLKHNLSISKFEKEITKENGSKKR